MPIEYITCFGKQSKEKYDKFPIDIPENLTFNTPIGLISDQKGNLWLADTGNNRVIVFNSELTKILNVIGKYGKGLLEFNMPFRLTHHPEKDVVYVTDMGNHRIQILEYNPDDYTIYKDKARSFSNHGFVEGFFNGPNGIGLSKIDGGYKVVVADEFADQKVFGRIQKFSENGDFIKTFGATENNVNINVYSFGTKVSEKHYADDKLEIIWPQGLAIHDEQVYIADVGNRRIIRSDFDGKGIPFKKNQRHPFFGLEFEVPYIIGPRDDTLGTPRGVTIIDEKLFVSDNHNNKIYIFDLHGNYVGKIQALDDRGNITPLAGPVEVAKINGDVNRIAVTNAVYPRIAILDISDISLDNYTAKLVKSVGNPRKSDGMFSYVRTVNRHNNDFFVLDAGNQRVQYWEYNGKKNDYKFLKSKTLKARLNSKQELQSFFASNLTHTPNVIPDQVFVTDKLNSKIHVFDLDFNWLASFGEKGNEPNQFNEPSAMYIHHNLDFYVADTKNNRICIWEYNPETKTAVHKKCIGKPNSSSLKFGNAGELNYPAGIAVDKEDNIYVADMYNHRIQVFDKNGGFLFKFGQYGYGESDLFLPTGISIFKDRVFVTDLVNRAVKIFDMQGNILEYYRGLGNQPGGMWFPFAISISEDGNIYLPDGTFNRVNVYNWQEER